MRTWAGMRTCGSLGGGRTPEPGHRRGPQAFPPPHFTSSKVRTTKPALRPGPEAVDSGGPQIRQRKARLRGQRRHQQNRAWGTHTHSSPATCPSAGGEAREGAGSLGRPHSPLASRIPPRDPQDNAPLRQVATGPQGHVPLEERRGGGGKHPGWHPRGRANLLTRACVASLLVPPVILRLYSKLLKLTYI